LERALCQYWPIKKELRVKVVATLASVLQDGEASNRERVAAARALISAGKCNLDSARTALLIQRIDVGKRFDAVREVGETLREIMERALAEDAAEEADPEPPNSVHNGHGP
jgi:hypothetical protein